MLSGTAFAVAQPLRDPEKGADDHFQSLRAIANVGGSDGVEDHVQAPEDDSGRGSSADERAASRSELYPYHPEHTPGYYLEPCEERMGKNSSGLIVGGRQACGSPAGDIDSHEPFIIIAIINFEGPPL